MGMDEKENYVTTKKKNPKPVSYTHLDVYKRQEEQDVTFQLIKDKFLEIVIPVSYTHLDVYKRQV